jgi:hypothetical protein
MSFLDSEHWIRLLDDDARYAKGIIDRINNKIISGAVKNREDRKQYLSPERANMAFYAELAFARYADIKWYEGDLSLRHLGDCEFGIEIKSTENPNYDLKVHKNEIHDKRPYVFVRSHFHPIHQFMGWMSGAEIRKFRAQNPKLHDMYLVPIDKLWTLTTLMEWIEKCKANRALKSDV